MTDFVRLVRSADAVLHATTQLGGALRASTSRLVGGVEQTRAVLLDVDSLLATAAELVQPTSTPVAESIAQTRAALTELRLDAPRAWAALDAGVQPIRDQLADHHRSLVDLLDAAPAPEAGVPDAATWDRAAALVRDGIELPPSLRGSGIALLDSEAGATVVARATEAIQRPYSQMRARDLADLARIVRRLDELDEPLRAAFAELQAGDADRLDRAARLVAAGIDLPDGWKLRPGIAGVRGRLRWPTLESATTRFRELLWSRRPDTRAAARDDLRLLRDLADATRPELVDRIPDGITDLEQLDPALLRELRHATVDDPARADALLALRQATDQLEPILARPKEHISDELQTIRDGLAGYLDVGLPDVEREIVAETIALVDRNLLRQSGGRKDGYRTWTDLGEVGRIHSSAELLDRLGADRIAAGTAGESIPAEALDPTAVGVGDDLLSW